MSMLQDMIENYDPPRTDLFMYPFPACLVPHLDELARRYYETWFRECPGEVMESESCGTRVPASFALTDESAKSSAYDAVITGVKTLLSSGYAIRSGMPGWKPDAERMAYDLAKARHDAWARRAMDNGGRFGAYPDRTPSGWLSPDLVPWECMGFCDPSFDRDDPVMGSRFDDRAAAWRPLVDDAMRITAALADLDDVVVETRRLMAPWLGKPEPRDEIFSAPFPMPFPGIVPVPEAPGSCVPEPWPDPVPAELNRLVYYRSHGLSDCWDFDGGAEAGGGDAAFEDLVLSGAGWAGGLFCDEDMYIVRKLDDGTFVPGPDFLMFCPGPEVADAITRALAEGRLPMDPAMGGWAVENPVDSVENI